ncbi:transcriptional sir2 family [Nannochloropsis oceanica]
MRRRRQDPISLLAGLIAENRKVAVIVGAGLSAASGVPVFRGDDPNAIWVRRAASMGTKAAFLRDPLAWYNEFWFPFFKHEYTRYLPNAGHEAIARLTNLSADLMVVTQNIDSLHQQTQVQWDHAKQLVEIHGRLGLYRCSSDEYCVLANEIYLKAADVFGPAVAENIQGEGDGAEMTSPVRVDDVPKCPECRKGFMMPLALMFDEMYDSHAFYQSDKAMCAFEKADALVFIGTSFQVNITNLAIEAGPRKRGIPVFNFNTRDCLSKRGGRRYDVYNIIGPAEETVNELMKEVESKLGLGNGVEKEKERGKDNAGHSDPRTSSGRNISMAVSMDATAVSVPLTADRASSSSDSIGMAVVAAIHCNPSDSSSSSSTAADPSYAYDTVPQPCLPRMLSEEEVEVDFRPCFGRLPHPDPEVEGRVESTWTELARQRQADGWSALFNASKFRLAGCRVLGGEGGGGGVRGEMGGGRGGGCAVRLVLEVWLTDYKTARGTNHHPGVAILQADGRAAHGDPGAYLSQKMGVSALLYTSDEDLIFISRSVKGCADFQGFIDTPGGHPEPSNVNLAFPPVPSPDLTQDEAASVLLRRKICHEIFSSSAQEVADEVGVPLDKLGPPKLLGLVRQLDFGSLPSATFLVQCNCSTADVHTYYVSGPKEIDESTGLVVVKKSELVTFLATPGVKLAPAARGSLALFAEHNLC